MYELKVQPSHNLNKLASLKARPVLKPADMGEVLSKRNEAKVVIADIKGQLETFPPNIKWEALASSWQAPFIGFLYWHQMVGQQAPIFWTFLALPQLPEAAAFMVSS